MEKDTVILENEANEELAEKSRERKGEYQGETMTFLAADSSIINRIFYRLQLNMKPSKINFDRVNSRGGAPFLRNHNHDELAGTVKRAYTQDGKVYADVVLADTPTGNLTKAEIEQGVRPGASVGVNPLKVEILEMDKDDPFNDLVGYDEWEFVELSSVPSPAIPNAGKLSTDEAMYPTIQLSISPQQERNMIMEARARFRGKHDEDMEDEKEDEMANKKDDMKDDEEEDKEKESDEEMATTAEVQNHATASKVVNQMETTIEQQAAVKDERFDILNLGVEHGQTELANTHLAEGGNLEDFKSKLLTVKYGSGAMTRALRNDGQTDTFNMVAYLRYMMDPTMGDQKSIFNEQAILERSGQGREGHRQIPFSALYRGTERQANEAAERLAITTSAISNAIPDYVDYARAQQFLVDMAPVLDLCTVLPGYTEGVYHAPFGDTNAVESEPGENNEISETDPTLGDIIGAAGAGNGLTPHKMGVRVKLTGETMRQTNGFIDMFIRSHMGYLLDSRVTQRVTNGTGAARQSLGVFRTAGVDLTTGTTANLDRRVVTKLMNDVYSENTNMGGSAFVLSGSSIGTLLNVQVSSVGGYLLGDNEGRVIQNAMSGRQEFTLLGHRALRHNSLADGQINSNNRNKRMIFGNWMAEHVVFFGGMEIIDDRLNSPGDLYITFVVFFDCGMVNTKNFQLHATTD